MIPSGILTYTSPLPSIRVMPGGEAYPASLGSLSNWTATPNPYTDKKIEGWHWDNRIFSDDTVENNAITLPANWDASTSGIPETYFQSGIGSNRDLALTGIELIPESGIVPGGWKNLWAPILNHGWYWDHNDEGYLFSDDSQVLYAENSGIVPTITQTFNRIVFPSIPKVGVPVVAEQYRWDQAIDKYEIALSARKKVEFTGIKNPLTFVRASTYDEATETILWDNIDVTDPEFILTTHCPGVDPGMAAVFNGQYVVSGEEIIGYGNGGHLKIHTRYAPIDDTKALSIQTYMAISGIRQSWTPVPASGIPTGYQVGVDYDMGILSFGDPDYPAIPTPPSGHAIEVGYWKTLRLEWEPDKTRNEIIATETNLNPIYRRSPRGFVYLSNAIDNPSSIRLEARLPVLGVDQYGPLYIGNTLANIVATVTDQNDLPLEDQDVTFYINNVPVVGSYGTTGSSVDSPTNEYGEARVFYVPPRSIDEIGEYIPYSRYSVDLTASGYPIATQVTKLNTDHLSVEGLLDEIFLYEVFTDDAIQGLYNSAMADDSATQLLDYYNKYFQEQDIWGPLGLQPASGLWELAPVVDNETCLLWHFDDISDYGHDSSGYGNDGAGISGAAFSATTKFGAGAMELSSTIDMFGTAFSLLGSRAEEGTLSFWFKPADDAFILGPGDGLLALLLLASGAYMIVGIGDMGGLIPQRSLYFTRYDGIGTPPTILTAPISLYADLDWHHYCATWSDSANKIIFYIDGTKKDEDASVVIGAGAFDAFWIGFSALNAGIPGIYDEYCLKNVVCPPTTRTPSASAVDWETAHRTVWNLARPRLFTGAVGEGRRVLASILRADLFNPHTFTSGAVGPFQPIAVENPNPGDYNVVYDTSTYCLPVPSGSMPGPISVPSGSPWGYFLVSPTTITLQASVYNERTDEVLLSNEIDIQLKIPPYLSGMWTIDAINATDIAEISPLLAGLTASGQKVPLGFRLRSNGVTLAGALDGVTFLDVN